MCLGVLYWIQLNLIETMAPFAILTVATVGCGIQALRQHHQWHLSKKLM
jgi:hypothetical protein